MPHSGLLRYQSFHRRDVHAGPSHGGTALLTRVASVSLGVSGMVAYNWWVFVPMVPGLMRSPDELFSDLEATGRPDAVIMQHLDLAAGLLLLAALMMARRRWDRSGRTEHLALMLFAAAGAVGGIFTESCPEGLSAVCRRMEWTLQLPLHHYIHILTGVVEFASITAVLVLAHRRTRGDATHSAAIYRSLTMTFSIAYPLLALSYLTNQDGALMEAVFFVGFTAIVLIELFEHIVGEVACTTQVTDVLQPSPSVLLNNQLGTGNLQDDETTKRATHGGCFLS